MCDEAAATMALSKSSHHHNYHRIVAQNFLRNISLDGTHGDTNLRIFKERGLHLMSTRKDMSPVSVVDDDTFAIDAAISRGNRRFSHSASDDRGRRRSQRSLQKTVSEAAPSSKRGGWRFPTSYKMPGKTRERSMSNTAESTRSRNVNSTSERSSTAAGLLHRFKQSLINRRHPEDMKMVSMTSTLAEPHSSTAGGRVVKWGVLPATSDESISARLSNYSAKGDILVSESEFDADRARKSRVCFCRNQVPVFVFSMLPFSRASVAAVHRKLEGNADVKSQSSVEDVGLRPFNLKEEEISYSPMLVPSHSIGSIMNMSASSGGVSSTTASGHASFSSCGYVGDVTPHASGLPLNLLHVDGLGANSSSKHDVSVDSELTLNRSSLQLDFRILDDPEFGAGEHKTILNFTSYMTSIIDYVDPEAKKQAVNEKFRKKYPDIHLSYSKYLSIKRDMKRLSADIGLDLLTLALAYSYFDTVVAKGLISKTNRKLISSSCLLLAAKMNDVKGGDLKHLLHKVEETFRLSRKEFLQYELPVVVALEFGLHIPLNELVAQYQKLLWSS